MLISRRTTSKEFLQGTQIKDTLLFDSVEKSYHRTLEKRIKEISGQYPGAIIQVSPKFETAGARFRRFLTDSLRRRSLECYTFAHRCHLGCGSIGEGLAHTLKLYWKNHLAEEFVAQNE